jgi:hypothetical protein
VPLTALVLAGPIGKRTRNHANSAHCSVGRYDHRLQTVAGENRGDLKAETGAYTPLPTRQPKPAVLAVPRPVKVVQDETSPAALGRKTQK